MCTRNVLVAVQWGNDDSAVSELLTVHGVGREETLKQGDGRIEHSGTLTTGLHSDTNLLKVRELGGDLGDLGVTATGKVRVTEERSQLVGLVLSEYVRERRRNEDVVGAAVPHRTGCSQLARTYRSWGPGSIPCGHRSWRGQQHP